MIYMAAPSARFPESRKPGTQTVLPQDHAQCEQESIMPNPIPEMTWDQKEAWKQPDISFFDFDTVPGYVVIEAMAFKALARYDTTIPSGVYEGKVWKRNQGGVDLLCWFGESPEPNTCSIEYRTIMLKELVDLLKGE